VVVGKEVLGGEGGQCFGGVGVSRATGLGEVGRGGEKRLFALRPCQLTFRVAEPEGPAHCLRPSANSVTDQGLGEGRAKPDRSRQRGVSRSAPRLAQLSDLSLPEGDRSCDRLPTYPHILP
jgi:hypothetical protein